MSEGKGSDGAIDFVDMVRSPRPCCSSITRTAGGVGV